MRHVIIVASVIPLLHRSEESFGSSRNLWRSLLIANEVANTGPSGPNDS